ncbi:glutathione S-transferase [Exidia glandulosa HHB12029]|uniref:glutathione transferase n=1 Tax=Exidia glandulosa HHB12029 TaxID=1314781 RepID=A0A165PPU4_EXIGL|nr:glutathione S-transferase [Exidia glandulosa HHB12029]
MVLYLHGARESTCTRRVAAVCKELGVPYEMKLVGWDKIKSPEHIAIQPFGQLPVLEDDGFFLYESRAIARYITLKYGKGSTLIPPTSDLQALAKFEAAASIEQSDFDPYASVIVFEKIFKLGHGGATDETKVAELTEKLDMKLQGYNRILAKSKYLAGDTLTLADLFHLPYGYMLQEATKSDLLQKYPNVARWWNEVSSRPSWQAVKDGA